MVLDIRATALSKRTIHHLGLTVHAAKKIVESQVLAFSKAEEEQVSDQEVTMKSLLI